MDTWAAFEARELICIKDLWICHWVALSILETGNCTTACLMVAYLNTNHKFWFLKFSLFKEDKLSSNLFPIKLLLVWEKSGGASDFNTPNLTFSDLLRLPEAEGYFTRHKPYFIGHSSTQMKNSLFELKS